MKTSLIILAALTAVAAAESIIPVAYTKDRYNETFGSAPFALETKVEVIKEEVKKEDPFKNLELKGIGQADGKDYVIIQRVGDSSSMRFWGQEPTADMFIKEVHWSDRMGETYVIVRKGSEEGKVSFNELAIHGRGASQVTPNPVNRGNGNFNNGLGTAAQRPPAPGFQAARPTINQPPVVPSSGFRNNHTNVNPVPPIIQSATPNTPSPSRPRIRVINNR